MHFFFSLVSHIKALMLDVQKGKISIISIHFLPPKRPRSGMSNLFIKWAALRTKILTGPQNHQNLRPPVVKFRQRAKKKVFTDSDQGCKSMLSIGGMI